MGKTKLLRKLTQEQLLTVSGGTYHKKAPSDASYPYKTFRIESGTYTDARDDLYLEVDVWDRNEAEDPKIAEDVADDVEHLFKDANIPAPPIYPTFFRESRFHVEDPDKSLQHIRLRFLVQLYEEV